MVVGICTSGVGVELVVGAAGAGKTTALDAAREAWQRSDRYVVGCALAARAAKQLQDGSGITSSTVDKLIRDIRCFPLPPRSVVVVDEAGMVGTRQLTELVDLCRWKNTKVVLVGDPAQLPAIDAGGAFAGLVQRVGAHELSENRRQVEPWERQALVDLREGRAREATAA